MTRASERLRLGIPCRVLITKLPEEKHCTYIGVGFKKVSTLTGQINEVVAGDDKASTRILTEHMRVSFLRRKILWIALIPGVVFVYPFESTVVPSQTALVVTEEWRPVQGVVVRQSWQHYSFESEGHEEDLRTDAHGRVTFARRTIRASVVRRMLHPVWNYFSQGVHAGFGIHTDMSTVNDPGQKQLGEGPVKAQEGEIVFRLRI